MRIPIRIKFSLLIFLLILIITGVIFWFTLNRVRNSLIQEIKLQGEILANVITLNAEDPLITNDDLYLARLVTDAVKNEGVGYAYIVDNDNIIRAHNKIELVGKTAEEFKPPPYLYNVTLPILLAGKKEIGKVSVGLETERIENTTYAMQVVLILISVSGLLIGILGAMLLSNYLTNPIQDLVKGVKSIAKGDFDQRIEKKSNDEIGDLTEAFNEMTKSLKEKEQIKDAFRRYVSHQVAEEIFKNPAKYIETLKGTRRKVTIFFADIRGFTPLAERLPAEEVVSLLNDVLTSMTNSIFRYEGTIDKFLGDGLMAVFGAPIVHKNDTDLAIHAAVDVQKSINLMNEERAKQNKDLIKVGIGVHTGEVVVGNIGTKERLDYTVIGDSVNLASRLQGVAGGGEIIISEHAFQEASVPYKFSEPMLIKVKGKAEPIKIYRVLY
ncbi:MAG TPA: HAMP domain-containing protein [candidate division WOR-3 bacterium]|uniref:HAMP domain-containing protein n=1 Tax=candidate division WOR-3 bacterium TaxID=2052148 RepID=A0A9C9K0E6_UNCW3|nr:HAMP domain-containing protein [candidate division WOR-3 bacterium]